MKKYPLLLLAIFVFLQSPGQVTRKSGKLSFEKISKGEGLHFPIIHSTDKLVEEKINIHLQLGELELIIGHEKENIFEIVTFNDGTIYGGKIGIDFQIQANSERNLSIRLFEASCGMTCAYWVKYYNFNPQNGDKYAIQDFFADSSFIAFKNMITPIRQQKIKKQITKLKQAGGYLDDLEEYLYPDIADDDLSDFYFSSDSLYFDNENLLKKNDKFYELDHITAISIEGIRHLLNNFGKSALITGEKLKEYQSMTEPQLYEGILGNKSYFYLLIRAENPPLLTGTYAYKTYGKAISLKGKLENSIYSFMELNDNREEVTVLVFEKDKETLRGYWQDKKGTKIQLYARRK